MAFVAVRTENPLGKRPLNLMARQQGMGWLGEIMPFVGPTSSQQAGQTDASSESSWLNALSYLQQWNTNLKQLEAIFQQHPGDQAWQSFGSNLLNNQQQYFSTANQFMTVYRAVYGHIPDGLTGYDSLGYLGQFDPVTAAAYAAVLSAVLIAAIAGYEYTLSLQTQAQALLQQQQTAGTQVNTAASLVQQAATAAASGDTTTANALYAQAAALNTQASQVSTAATTAASSTSITAFLQNNFGLLAGLALAVVVLPPLIKKI